MMDYPQMLDDFFLKPFLQHIRSCYTKLCSSHCDPTRTWLLVLMLIHSPEIFPCPADACGTTPCMPDVYTD